MEGEKEKMTLRLIRHGTHGTNVYGLVCDLHYYDVKELKKEEVGYSVLTKEGEKIYFNCQFVYGENV